MKILIIHHTMPDVPGFTTKMFEGVLPILRKHLSIKTIWVIHSQPKLATKSESDETIINMPDYKNAVEILNQENPDLIYVIPGLSIPDYAFLLAARFLKIPVIGSIDGKGLLEKKTKGVFSTMSVIQSHNFAKKIGQFFNKHLFLIKTQSVIGWNIFQIIRDLIFFVNVYIPIFYKYPGFLPKFELDRIFVQSDESVNELVALGCNKSKLIIAGNPTFDEFFQLSKVPNNNNIKKSKKDILILTSIILGESRKNVLGQRRHFIEGLLKEIPRDEFNITIKIHPSNEDLIDYTNILEQIDSKVTVTQNANLVELISNTDIIICPVTSTSVVCSLILKKPIIIWNVFNVEMDSLLQNELALSCKNQSEILDQIRKAERWLPDEKRTQQFLREYLPISGENSSERIATEILNYLKSRSPHIFNT